VAALRRDDVERLAGHQDYADYILAARRRFEQGQAATVQELRRVYRRAAARVREDIERTAVGTLRRSHLEALARNLERRARELSEETLEAIRRGVYLSTEAGTMAPQNITARLVREAWDPVEVGRLFAPINERAAMMVLARTGKDGLRLSDRVWRAGEKWRRAVARVVEDGVARGVDPRKLAREVERYLQPGVGTAHKLETRRRLKVPKDLSYEAMRLVRTEMGNAFHEASIAANGAAPSYRGIYWRLSSSHPVKDVCDDYAAHNGNGFWPKGEEPAKPHPQCFCVVIPAHEDPEQFADRLRAWLDDPQSQPDIEEWYTGAARAILTRPARFSGRGGGGGSGSGRGGWPSDPDGLIRWAATTGQRFTPAQLQTILRHVATQPFSTQLTRLTKRGAVNVDDEVLGVLNRCWPGHQVRLGERLGRERWVPSDVAHWLRHRNDFGGVSYDEYHRLVRHNFLDPAAQVYTWVALPEFVAETEEPTCHLGVLVPAPPGAHGEFSCSIYCATRGKILTGFRAMGIEDMMQGHRIGKLRKQR